MLCFCRMSASCCKHIFMLKDFVRFGTWLRERVRWDFQVSFPETVVEGYTGVLVRLTRALPSIDC